MLFFGDLRLSSVVAEREQQGTILATSRERHMDQDQIAIRATRREHIIHHDLGDASTTGPVAVLLGGA